MAAETSLELNPDYTSLIRREDCRYTSCYCEENIWHLCKSIESHAAEELNAVFVVFVSNDNKTIPLWMQRGGDDPDGLVFWDYHVFLLHHPKNSSNQNAMVFVFDLDSRLDFPCEFQQYFEKAIKPDTEFKEKFQRKFRVMTGKDYLLLFGSDRSHMLTGTGTWMATPPEWPLILAEGNSSSFPQFLRMDTEAETLVDQHSSVFTTDEFYQRFSIGITKM